MTNSPLVGVIAVLPVAAIITPLLVLALLRIWGVFLQAGSKDRRHAICVHVKEELKAAKEKRKRFLAPVDADVDDDVEDDDWEKIEAAGSAPNGDAPKGDWGGIVGFFHPFCNAGGGGERVLWAAIAATQRQWPNAICAVYTGDHEIEKSAIVAKVKERFDIVLREETLTFIYLTTRHFVLASNWPYFTLLGQSLGSLVLAWDALSLLVPDIFIDTMGYAFALAFCKYLFPSIPTAAYVHYPTISTDMLSSLDDSTGTKGIHSGLGTGWKGQIKRWYWHLFARLYGWVGRQIDLVTCNSTWTYNHISTLWKPSPSLFSSFNNSGSNPRPTATILYPPCPVENLISSIPLTLETSTFRSQSNIVLYIAQFRPEKNHSLVLRAFARYFHSRSTSVLASDSSPAHAHTDNPPHLVLIGSVRTSTPDEKHIYALRIEARELGINSHCTFITDAPYVTIETFLRTASIGVNGMYAEHFGIGNVEGLAAGLIPVVHRSGGPFLDIVVPFDGGGTERDGPAGKGEVGFHAETEEEFAECFARVEAMGDQERWEMRSRGRESSRRFGEEVFARGWVGEMERLIALYAKWNPNGPVG